MGDFAEVVRKQKAKAKPLREGKFGAFLATFEGSHKGILKIAKPGRQLFRGVPHSEMHKREVAAYRLDRDILHFDVVPETLLVKWNGQEASMQEFRAGHVPRDLVPGIFDRKLDDWKYRIAKLFGMLNLDDMLRIVLLDLITNNVDRHGKNILIDTHNDRVWAIDNALSFGRTFRYYRNVFHKYLFFRTLEIDKELLAALDKIKPKPVEACLKGLVSQEEALHVYLRIRFVVDHADRLAFKRVSQGDNDRDGFPTYRKWFKRKTDLSPDALALVIAPPVSPEQAKLVGVVDGVAE